MGARTPTHEHPTEDELLEVMGRRLLLVLAVMAVVVEVIGLEVMVVVVAGGTCPFSIRSHPYNISAQS